MILVAVNMVLLEDNERRQLSQELRGFRWRPQTIEGEGVVLYELPSMDEDLITEEFRDASAFLHEPACTNYTVRLHHPPSYPKRVEMVHG